MPKFRTVITHKPSSIELFGHVIELKPDASGICTFDVPEDRADVADRLRKIPEGFAEIADEAPAAPMKQATVPPAPPIATVTTDAGAADLDAMDKDALVELAKSLGIALHHNAGASGIRAKIREAQSS